MLGKKKVLAIIPARGGSKGIPKKNIALLAGKPLIAYTIEAAKKSRYIDLVVVSTDADEIKRIALKYHAEVIDRPAELATDTASIMPVLQHAIKEVEKKNKLGECICVLLQTTSPLRSVTDIDETIEKMEDDSVETAETFNEEHPIGSYFRIKGDVVLPLSPADVEKRRQDQDVLYRENGCVYAFKKSLILAKGTIYGKNHKAVIMPKERSIDIDNLDDLKQAEALLNQKRQLKS